MKIYHHNDIDGRAAAFCIHENHWKHSNVPDSPYDYIEIDYTGNFDKHTIRDDVFLVDISISESTFEKLINLCETARTVTWIDHHQTSLDIVNKYIDKLQSIDNLTYFVSTCASGAALTYAFLDLPKNTLYRMRNTNKDEYYYIEATCEYITKTASGKSVKRIHTNLIKRDKKDLNKETLANINNICDLPEWLHLVDTYDCFKHDDRERALSFQHGIESFDTRVVIEGDNDTLTFNEGLWGEIKSAVYLCISNGETIRRYMNQRFKKELSNTFVWEFEGHKFICKNCNGNSLEFLDKINEYDAAIRFNYNGLKGIWSYSVYVSDVSNFNAKEFCEKFGGGGHIKAAGFTSKSLIFNNSKSYHKEKVIYLSSAINDQSEEFINSWNKSKAEKIKDATIYSPSDREVGDPNIDSIIQKKSMANFFMLSGNIELDAFTIAEAVESSHNTNTIMIVYDKFSNLYNNAAIEKYKSIGRIIESNGGTFRYYRQNGTNGIMIGISYIKHFKINSQDITKTIKPKLLMDKIVSDCINLI